MFRTFALIAATALMAGCAAQRDFKPPSNDDPANPQAAEAPVRSILAPLTLQPPPSAASDRGSSADGSGQHMDTKRMDMSGMSGMGHRQSPNPAQPGMEGMHHHTQPGAATRPAATQALYTCKMHPQVVSDHPGKCPICGMKQVPREGAK